MALGKFSKIHVALPPLPNPLLIEPAICLTEIIRNITKYLGTEAGKTQENNLRRMVSIWEICDKNFLLRIKGQVGIEIYHPKDIP